MRPPDDCPASLLAGRHVLWSVTWRDRKLLEELARVSAPEHQALLAKQLADVTPAVRFCQYQIAKDGAAGLGTASESEIVQPDADTLQVLLQLLPLLSPSFGPVHRAMEGPCTELGLVSGPKLTAGHTPLAGEAGFVGSCARL